MTNLRPARKDGIPARIVGPWSRDKLYLIDQYMGIFCRGMHNKWSTLVYADFLTGPGWCIERGSHQEYPGSPLLAASHPEFTRLFLNDRDERAADALRARLVDQPD